LEPARHLQVPADPVSRHRRGRRLDPQAQLGPDLRRPQRARAHARRQRERPERGAPLPRLGPRRGLVFTGPAAPGPGAPAPEPGSAEDAGKRPAGAQWPVRRIRWSPAGRIVPTRHPAVYLFDRVAQPEDFEALYALEALTDDRVRDEVGTIGL